MLLFSRGALAEKKMFEEVEKFKADFPEKNYTDWSGFNIEEKARKAGKNMVVIYDTAYRYYSDFEHNNIMSLYSHMNMKEKGKFIVLSEPNENQVEMTLRESFFIFIDLFDIYCDTFRLDYSSKIKNLKNDFELLYQSK